MVSAEKVIIIIINRRTDVHCRNNLNVVKSARNKNFSYRRHIAAAVSGKIKSRYDNKPAIVDSNFALCAAIWRTR